jgi:hypothetical protein
MSPQLKAMVVSAGVFLMGGVAFFVATPQPATRTMLELKDAGILEGQRLVQVCPERLTAQTIRRINAKQPGILRPSQAYGIVARSARCFNPDGGNCLRPSDGLPRVDAGEATVVVPSLRANLSGLDPDAGVGDDDGGDNDDIDDAYQYATTSCSLLTCNQFDDGVDAGTYVSPYANGCLGGLNRLALQPMPCMLPDPFKHSLDGGWYEGVEVDCKGIGPYGESDGGPRWRGFNVTPREYAVGVDCLPSACVIVAGDPVEWL